MESTLLHPRSFASRSFAADFSAACLLTDLVDPTHRCELRGPVLCSSTPPVGVRDMMVLLVQKPSKTIFFGRWCLFVLLVLFSRLASLAANCTTCFYGALYCLWTVSIAFNKKALLDKPWSWCLLEVLCHGPQPPRTSRLPQPKRLSMAPLISKMATSLPAVSTGAKLTPNKVPGWFTSWSLTGRGPSGCGLIPKQVPCLNLQKLTKNLKKYQIMVWGNHLRSFWPTFPTVLHPSWPLASMLLNRSGSTSLAT